jgi:hypothetical protein
MDPTLRFDDPAHLSRLERECRILERLLHHAARERAEIPACASVTRAAIRVGPCKLCEFLCEVCAPCNLGLITLEFLYGFLFGLRDNPLLSEDGVLWTAALSVKH